MVEEEAMGYQGKNSEDPDAVLNELNHDEIIERDMQEVEEEILLAEGQPPPAPKPVSRILKRKPVDVKLYF